MIVTNSLLDESSTDESEILVPRPGDDSIISSEEDWGVVSMDGHSEHSGELILDGVEEPELIVENNSTDVPNLPGEGSQLSVPGADSVPTVVGSIDGLPHATEELEDHNNQDEDELVENEETNSLEQIPPVKQEQEEETNLPNKNRLVSLLVPALLLVPTIACSICLYNERNSLQVSVMELEDVVSSLHLEAEQRKLEEQLLWEDKEFLQLSSLELQEKVFALKREAERNKKMEQLQLETLNKERTTLRLYVLHLQDLVSNLKKKAAKEKREGDVLFQDKKFLEWSASNLQQKVKDLQKDAEKRKEEENLRMESLRQEKFSLQGLVAKAQNEVVRVKSEAERKLRQEDLRWNNLFQEKISLRVSTARLEEQVSKLKRKAKQGREEEEIRMESLQKERDVLLSTIVNLEDQVFSLKEEAKKRKKVEPDFLNLNSCGASAGDTILVDNCWLNAKANIQLGHCANDAKDVFHNALHDFSESVSNWMESYSSGTHHNSSTAATTASDSMTQVIRKVDHLGKQLWNATLVSNKRIKERNTTSTQVVAVRDVGKSVARMIRTVDSFATALWNATAFKMYTKNANTTGHNQNLSFFSRMDLNGKLGFESFFSPSASNRNARRIGLKQRYSSSLERIFQKVSDVILSAGSVDQVMEGASALFLSTNKTNSGGVLVSTTMERLCSAMAFNHTSKKYLMQVAKGAFEEVSLTHAVTM